MSTNNDTYAVLKSILVEGGFRQQRGTRNFIREFDSNSGRQRVILFTDFELNAELQRRVSPGRWATVLPLAADPAVPPLPDYSVFAAIGVADDLDLAVLDALDQQPWTPPTWPEDLS